MLIILKKLASLKVTCILLVAFLLLLFWGTLGMASAGENSAVAAERFFNSYFVWTLGVVPIPAFKLLAILAVLHLVLNMFFRMPRGKRNVGLWGMHLALLILLAGGVAGSELKKEYSGYGLMVGSVTESGSKVKIQDLAFFDSKDGPGGKPVEIVPNLKEQIEKEFLNWDEPALTLANGFYTLHYKGYVDMAPGKRVALFSATYDSFRWVPYAFSILFILSALLHYLLKVRNSSREKKLDVGKASAIVENGSCSVGKIATTTFLVCFAGLGLFAPSVEAAVVPDPDQAILWNGEIRAFDSFAREVLDDLSGKVKYACSMGEGNGCPRKMSAYEVVSGILENPEAASKWKLFKILRSDVSQALDLPADERYVNYAALARSRDRLELYASRKDDHPATREMQRLYANVLEYELVASPPFKIVEGRRLLEVFYHRANLCLVAFILAFAGFLISLVNLNFKARKMDVAANVACALAATTLCGMMVLRLCISGRPPLSNLYEIILLVALLLEAFQVGAFIFCRNRLYSLMVPVTFMAALLLFFDKFILETGNTFQAIPAVLNSSVFLTLHVFTIALGFAGMILSGVVAHVMLFRTAWARRNGMEYLTQQESLPVKNLLYGTLIFGAVLTTVGTLLGGVWADFAWGRFWGFDPKECGALFVILWAMLALHLRGGRIVTPFGFTLLNSFNVIVTFLCWFGINLLGVGLHSYGFQNGTALWLTIFVVTDAALITALAKYIGNRK